MAYSDVVVSWTAALERAGVEFSIDRPEPGGSDDLLQVFGADLLDQIEKVGYVGKAEIPWTAETLGIYALSEIGARQRGYRVDAHTGQPSLSWNQEHHVFADWGGDPVSIDAGGAIWFARRGEGSWVHRRIASDLQQFVQALPNWVTLFVIDRATDIYTEDYEVRKEFREIVETDVLGFLPVDDRSAFLDLLFG